MRTSGVFPIVSRMLLAIPRSGPSTRRLITSLGRGLFATLEL
jgi:hypothetical protein